MKKTLISTAIAAAVGLSAATAQAVTVTHMVLEDVGSTVGGAYSATLDGRSGGFRFNTIDPSTYFGASLFTGNVGTGTINFQGAANATGSFSTGFLFTGSPFVPYTYGAGINADITGAVLTFSDLEWGGNFAGMVDFNLPPDSAPVVNWLVDNGDGTYKGSFQWQHYITQADDPTGSYVGFTARWILEGTLHTDTGTTVIPVPAAAWLMASGLVGLVGVARRRKAMNKTV